MLSKTHSKYIQTLHHKKNRDANNVFIAEGNKTVMDLLQSKKTVCTEMFGTEQWLHDNEPLIRKYYSGSLQVVQDYELNKISSLTTANHVLAVFNKLPAVDFSSKNKITLLLDEIQDPGNMGTIIRTADWFGVPNIVCSLHSADMYNPKVIQSTMGSIARVNMVYTNLAEWIRLQKPVKVYAAALNGKNISHIQGVKEGIIIIGNESKGISAELLQLADENITISKIGGSESLNAAVAAGIILSHIF